LIGTFHASEQILTNTNKYNNKVLLGKRLFLKTYSVALGWRKVKTKGLLDIIDIILSNSVNGPEKDLCSDTRLAEEK